MHHELDDCNPFREKENGEAIADPKKIYDSHEMWASRQTGDAISAWHKRAFTLVKRSNQVIEQMTEAFVRVDDETLHKNEKIALDLFMTSVTMLSVPLLDLIGLDKKDTIRTGVRSLYFCSRRAMSMADEAMEVNLAKDKRKRVHELVVAQSVAPIPPYLYNRGIRTQVESWQDNAQYQVDTEDKVRALTFAKPRGRPPKLRPPTYVEALADLRPQNLVAAGSSSQNVNMRKVRKPKRNIKYLTPPVSDEAEEEVEPPVISIPEVGDEVQPEGLATYELTEEMTTLINQGNRFVTRDGAGEWIWKPTSTANPVRLSADDANINTS